MSIKKNLLSNGVSNAIQKLIKVFEQLLLVPVFISAWGIEYYGEWLTLTIVPTMLAFSDLGFGSAAANGCVLKYASGEKQEAADVIKSGFFIVTLSILGSFVIGGVAILVLDHYHVFNKSVIPRLDAIWAVSLLMIARVLNFYQQLFEAYFRAARKAALSTNLLSVYSILNLSLGCLVLIMGGGIIWFSSVALLVSVAFNLGYCYKANTLRVFDSVVGVVKKDQLRVIASKGLGYLLSPIWQAIYFQGTTFVVRLLLGPVAVAVFNTVRTVSRSANQGFSMVNNTFFPEFQYELGAGRMDKARRLFRIAVGGVFLLATLSTIFLWIFGPKLYQLWTKNELHAPDGVWNIFIIGIAFNALWWTAEMVFRSLNKPYVMAVIGLCSSLVSVLASYFFAKEYGLIGAAWGNLLLEIIMALTVLPIGCKLIGQSLVKLPFDIVSDAFSLLKRRSTT